MAGHRVCGQKSMDGRVEGSLWPEEGRLKLPRVKGQNVAAALAKGQSVAEVRGQSIAGLED